jgi:hypothetical protein
MLNIVDNDFEMAEVGKLAMVVVVVLEIKFIE